MPSPFLSWRGPESGRLAQPGSGRSRNFRGPNCELSLSSVWLPLGWIGDLLALLTGDAPVARAAPSQWILPRHFSLAGCQWHTQVRSMH
jgi:hypothetical protein